MRRVLQSIHRRLLPERPAGAAPYPELDTADLASLLAAAAFKALRGVWHGWFLGRHGGRLLVGRGARLMHRRHLYVGRNVKIEEGAEIHALSVHGVRLGDGVTIGRCASLRPSGYYGTDCGHGLTIGSGSAIGAFAWIGASAPVIIGANVLMGPRVVLIPENHVFSDPDLPIKAQGVQPGAVTIEDDCWLGADCKILAGVHIGRGSVVAAGAVVTRDVPAGHVVGGVPARTLKVRPGSTAELRRSA